MIGRVCVNNMEVTPPPTTQEETRTMDHGKKLTGKNRQSMPKTVT